MPSPLRVVLCTRTAPLRHNLLTVLHNDKTLTIVAKTDSLPKAVALCAKTKPGLLLLDSQLLDYQGVLLCRSIRAALPALKLVVLTPFTTNKELLAKDSAMYSILLAGAAAYTLIPDADSSIPALLHRPNLDPEFREYALGRLATELDRPYASPSALTQQQQDFLAATAAGKTNQELAKKFNLDLPEVASFLNIVLEELTLSRSRTL